jgi:hypothetical protein
VTDDDKKIIEITDNWFKDEKIKRAIYDLLLNEIEDEEV